MSKLAEIEALLFVAGEEGITTRQIADILSLPPTGVVQSLDKLSQKYSSGAIAKLLSFDLIREDGKKEVLGRPNLYVTTEYFLDYMGVNHLEELPKVEDIELDPVEGQLFSERTEELDEN